MSKMPGIFSSPNSAPARLTPLKRPIAPEELALVLLEDEELELELLDADELEFDEDEFELLLEDEELELLLDEDELEMLLELLEELPDELLSG